MIMLQQLVRHAQVTSSAAWTRAGSAKSHLKWLSSAAAADRPETVASTERRAKGELLERYQNALDSGKLLPDEEQATCAARLSALADQLIDYTDSLAGYRRQLQAYQEERRRKREELRAQDEQEAAAEAARDGARDGSAVAKAARWWRQQVMGEQPAPKLTREQRAVLAASRRERRLDQLLGPPLQPPPAPKGVYIYGEVGSGKSLLAGMFYELVDQQALVPLRRHLHFNSAMLEVNSRIWGIEQERMRADLKAVEATVEHQHLRDARSSSGPGGTEAAQQAAWQARGLALRPKLAARRNRMLMLRRAPSQHSEALARANAVILTRAAQGLIRGGAADARGLEGRQPALLYFDELQITDPFTACSLKGLMEELVAEGAVLCITSNRHPSQLTNHGLHEDLFNHFVATLQQACDIVQLGTGARDYRRLALMTQAAGNPSSRNYLHPLTSETREEVERRWAICCSTAGPADAERVPVMFGRSIQLGADQVAGGAARFRFEQLCRATLGAADYQALARRFHTIFLTDVPALSLATRDQARRFIVLLDELYNAHTKLVCTAAVEPDQLFSGAESDEPLVDFEGLQFETAAEGGRLRRDVMAVGGVAPVGARAQEAQRLQARLGGLEEQFAFRRAVSRLHEMQTDAYLQRRMRS